MWGVIADSRANIPAVKDQDGFAIQAYVQSQTSQVVPGTIPYAIRTVDGNIAGYTVLQVNPGPVSVLLLQLRPAFSTFSSDISSFLTNFINSGNFVFDTLT
jgi:hypothetical protein